MPGHSSLQQATLWVVSAKASEEGRSNPNDTQNRPLDAFGISLQVPESDNDCERSLPLACWVKWCLQRRHWRGKAHKTFLPFWIAQVVIETERGKKEGRKGKIYLDSSTSLLHSSNKRPFKQWYYTYTSYYAVSSSIHNYIYIIGTLFSTAIIYFQGNTLLKATFGVSV